MEREELAKRFAQRVRLLKMTEDECAEEARQEHRFLTKWAASKSQKIGSFIWFCDEFGMEFDAVRRAIQERKQ